MTIPKDNLVPPAAESPKGLALAVSSYLIWGLMPLYFALTIGIDPIEVLAHRIVWSVPIALAVLWWLGRTSDLRAALTNPRMLGMAMLTALLVSINWGTYIYALQTGRAMETALGYYINPLLAVLMGRVLLGEKLDGLQIAAVCLAALGVAILTWEAGELPLIAVAITLSWAFYSYFRKSLPIGANQGFALEVLLLLPLGLAALAWFETTPEGGVLGRGDPAQIGLMLLAGVLSAVPLLLYGNGAKLLRLTTLGVLQYISPTIVFLLSIFVLGENFDGARQVAFPMIWGAVALYSLAMFRRNR